MNIPLQYYILILAQNLFHKFVVTKNQKLFWAELSWGGTQSA